MVTFGGGNGITNNNGDTTGCEVYNIAYERTSKSLFVAGNFANVNGLECNGFAVWNR
jgi:hypothetical protein